MTALKLFIVLCFTIFKTHASEDNRIIVDPAAPLLAVNNNHQHIRLPGQEYESLGPLALIAGVVGAGACGAMCCTNPLVVVGLIASSATGCYGIIHISSACCE